MKKITELYDLGDFKIMDEKIYTFYTMTSATKYGERGTPRYVLGKDLDEADQRLLYASYLRKKEEAEKKLYYGNI